jgi:hypothetical protein
MQEAALTRLDGEGVVGAADRISFLFLVKTAFPPSTSTATPLTSKRPHPDRERGHDWSLYLQGNKNPVNSLDETQESSEKP